MATRQRYAKQTTPPPEAGLPEIPQATDDAEAVREDGGGRAGGQGGGGPDQQAAPERSLVAQVLAAWPTEVVGGRYLATVDGERVVLADTVNGVPVLTRTGEYLSERFKGG